MTSVRLRISVAALTVLVAAGAQDVVLAQTLLTLEDAIQRAQGDTADARALASSIEEANARIQRAQSGFWPRVDLAETVQRGNQPVYVFSSLLSQRRFTAANFAIPALNHPDPVTNTRTLVALEQPIYNAGLTRLGIQAATLERDMATTARDSARQELGFRAAQAFVRVPDARLASSPKRMSSRSTCTWRTCASGTSQRPGTSKSDAPSSPKPSACR